MKKFSKVALFLILCASLVTMTGCGKSGSDSGSSDEKVIIYSNADEEAVNAMKAALDSNGYKDQYLFQTFGTSELGGKLIAEGTNIEADIVTMSSFYLDSAQAQNNMFQKLTYTLPVVTSLSSYFYPITAQEGAILINTEVMKENNLEMPTSIKDLADSKYKGFISVTDIQSSSTAWLLMQAIVSEYGEDGAKEVLKGIYENAGDHIEESGSAPLKKVRAGEVAIGFGLRHQAVADKAKGLPIDYVDPTEGTFTLSESVAVVDKGDKTNTKAMEMSKVMVEKARADLLKTYPVALYEGETQDSEHKSANEKTFKEALTLDLLKQHQAISEAAKEMVGK